MKKAVIGALCLMTCGVPLRAAGDTASIRSEVREQGGFERMLVWTDAPYQLASLVGLSDLVIEATPTASRSYLDHRETHIYTDYTFEVRTLVKNRRRTDLRVGKTVTVRRESGTVLVDGRTATSIENEFPPFGGEQPYVLFLKEAADRDVYVVTAGPQGAFLVGERVTPLAGAGPSRWAPASRERFFEEIRALLKFME